MKKSLIGATPLLLVAFLIFISMGAAPTKNDSNSKLKERGSTCTNNITVYCASNNGMVITQVEIHGPNGYNVYNGLSLSNGQRIIVNDPNNYYNGAAVTVYIWVAQPGTKIRTIGTEDPWDCYVASQGSELISLSATQTCDGLVFTGSSYIDCP